MLFVHHDYFDFIVRGEKQQKSINILQQEKPNLSYRKWAGMHTFGQAVSIFKKISPHMLLPHMLTTHTTQKIF